jgi:hypothetical protein
MHEILFTTEMMCPKWQSGHDLNDTSEYGVTGGESLMDWRKQDAQFYVMKMRQPFSK